MSLDVNKLEETWREMDDAWGKKWGLQRDVVSGYKGSHRVGETIGYWSKHHLLHSWMIRLGNEHGEPEGSFEYTDDETGEVSVEFRFVYIDHADLNRLRIVVETQEWGDYIDQNQGYFQSADKVEKSLWYKEHDLCVIDRTAKRLDAGELVWYDGSW